MKNHENLVVFYFIYFFQGGGTHEDSQESGRPDNSEFRELSRGFYKGHCRNLLGSEPTPNLPTNIAPTKIAWLKLSEKSPMDMSIPPLRIKIMLESNPLKSIMLVRKLATLFIHMCGWGAGSHGGPLPEEGGQLGGQHGP